MGSEAWVWVWVSHSPGSYMPQAGRWQQAGQLPWGVGASLAAPSELGAVLACGLPAGRLGPGALGRGRLGMTCEGDSLSQAGRAPGGQDPHRRVPGARLLRISVHLALQVLLCVLSLSQPPSLSLQWSEGVGRDPQHWPVSPRLCLAGSLSAAGVSLSGWQCLFAECRVCPVVSSWPGALCVRLPSPTSQSPGVSWGEKLLHLSGGSSRPRGWVLAGHHGGWQRDLMPWPLAARDGEEGCSERVPSSRSAASRGEALLYLTFSCQEHEYDDWRHVAMWGPWGIRQQKVSEQEDRKSGAFEGVSLPRPSAHAW